MPGELYQQQSTNDRRQALETAQKKGGQYLFLLEKDIWIVATLDVLFSAPFGNNLIFKGGTSLSKVWKVIRRFSEDIDITYDIRAFAPDLVSGAGEEAIPPTHSQQKRWTRAIRTRLTEWVNDQACQFVSEKLAINGFEADVRAQGDRLYIHYESLFEQPQLTNPEIITEFGARSTGEPHATHTVSCDSAALIPNLIFPEARPKVLLAERTFWEKATAIHVYCRQQRRRGERLSRHWHDLVRLDDSGIAACALADPEIAKSVARHKAMFFAENDVNGERIDYHAAVTGDLQLVPSDAAYEVLAEDYANMQASGILLDEKEPFSSLMERYAAIESRANSLLA